MVGVVGHKLALLLVALVRPHVSVVTTTTHLIVPGFVRGRCNRSDETTIIISVILCAFLKTY